MQLRKIYLYANTRVLRGFAILLSISDLRKSGARNHGRRFAKEPISGCERAYFMARNRLYRHAIWALSECEMAFIAIERKENGPIVV